MSHSQQSQSETGRSTDVPNTAASDAATGAILNATQLRWVKIAIGVMTLMFAIGIPLLIGRIIYLARSGGTPAAQPIATPAKLLETTKISLPEGATVRGVTTADGRLAVHFVTVSGSEEVHILDLNTGVVVNRTEIVRPRSRF